MVMSLTLPGKEDSSRREERSEVRVPWLLAGRKGLLHIKVFYCMVMHAMRSAYIPEHILCVGKVVGFEISEDGTGVLNVGHSLKIERLVDGPIPLIHLTVLCVSAN